MQKKDKKYIFFFLLTVFLVKGCGLFETRDPEQPETRRSTYSPPTSAQIVIENLSNSILEKNSENYNKCFSSVKYEYVPDARTLQLYEILFANWNQASEKRYLDNLILETDNDQTSVYLPSGARYTQITPDSAIYQATYNIIFQHRRTNVPKSGKGNLNIVISTDENDLFYIRKWEDFRQNDTDFTWSELRANFSN